MRNQVWYRRQDLPQRIGLKLLVGTRGILNADRLSPMHQIVKVFFEGAPLSD
jgi:hypothetical protein